jgi:hypothetical protein
MSDQKDIREHIEERLDSYVADPEKQEKLNAIIDRAFGQTKGDYFNVTCKHCHRDGKYWIEYPVTERDVKALKDMVELTKGKVAQKVDHTVKIEFDVPMEEWTDEQLRQVASMNVEVIEDGEFEILGLPAPDPQSEG